MAVALVQASPLSEVAVIEFPIQPKAEKDSVSASREALKAKLPTTMPVKVLKLQAS